MARKGKGLSPKQQRKLQAEIRKLIGKNYTDEEIIEALNVRPNDLKIHKKKILDADRVAFKHLDTSAVYSDYIQKMGHLIKELDEVKTKFRNRGQFTALVAAIKEKKNIHDSVIKMGQDFGFIDRKAKEMKVDGEITFSTMSEEQVKEEIQKEVQRLNDLSKGGVIEMREEVLGVTDSDIKRFLPSSVKKEPPKSGKTKKAKKKVKAKVKLALRK